MNTKPTIKVYGAGWCTKTGMLNNFMQSEWIDFEFFNVEEDEAAAAYVRSKFDGKLLFPVIVIDDQVILNPSIGELKKHLSGHL